MSLKSNRVFILDTTLRDGALMPRLKMNLDRKMQLAQILDQAGVDIIEVSYPRQSVKDFEEIFLITPLIQKAIVCALAGSQTDEIQNAALGIQKAVKGRIHIYTNVGQGLTQTKQAQTLDAIQACIKLARNYCDDVEWSAFDATRSEPDFLVRAINMAIANGATTINIPDSLGQCTPAKFSRLLENLFDNVANINDAIISVHCHNDLGLAVSNSLAALEVGVRQIECTLKGLGARKGNAALEKIAIELNRKSKYVTNLELSILSQASAMC